MRQIDGEEENDAFEYELTDEEKELLGYLSALRFVDKAFLARKGKSELMDSISKKYPDCVFRRGDNGYCLNEKFALTLNALPSANKEVIKDYYEYLREDGKDIEAFIFALNHGDKDMINDTVVAIVNKGVYTFELCNFVNANKESMEILFDQSWSKEHYGLEFIAGLQLYYSENYEDSMSLFNDVADMAEKNSKMEIDARFMAMKNLGRMKKYREIVVSSRALIEERTKDGDINMDLFETLFCRIPDFMKAGEIAINRENCKHIESLMIKDEYKDRYWYAKALQVAAELHFDWGNYGKATAYIKELQELIPFYTMPYKLMSFYYYMGDMPLAVSMAKKALAEELNNNIEADLVDVYTLLAKTSMYFNRYSEGLEYIDNAIKSASPSESAKYPAYALRAIICAKMGRREYARDYAMIYTKYAEINSPKNAYFLYGALAYCCFRQNDYDTAILYANKCIREASARSGIWLIAVAVALNILITRDDTTNVNGLMEKLFRTCRVYGMTAIVVDYYECFEKLFKYARSEDINVDYVAEMERKYRDKLMEISANGELNVKLMGTTSVTVSGKELNWKTKKAKELFLMYVWHRGEGLDRNFILSTLWPDYVYVSAINNLKTTNNIIRNILTSANVIHKLEYANGKYTLNIENIRCDYFDFKEKLDSYSEKATVKERVEANKELLGLFNGEFAAEVSLPLFRKHGDGIKEKLMLDAIKSVEELIEEGDITEARRMISYVSAADANGLYSEYLAEQEKRIAEYFERKE
ncbi:MAG: hypothetical protein ACI4SK_01490 [Christensenellales bacterium]